MISRLHGIIMVWKGQPSRMSPMVVWRYYFCSTFLSFEFDRTEISQNDVSPFSFQSSLLMHQTRQYPTYLWASTDVEGTEFNVAQNTGFDRLFDYISGENEDNVAIDMTTPVLTYVQPGQACIPSYAPFFSSSIPLIFCSSPHSYLISLLSPLSSLPSGHTVR